MNETLSNNEYKLISSLSNKKFRDINNLYVIEGEHLVEEYIKSRLPNQDIKFVIKRNDYENYDLLDRISYLNVHSLNRAKFDKLCDTKSPQGILAVVEKKIINSNEGIKFAVALDNVNDPGNLGTILRTCYWYGVDKVLIGENSAEVFNPKTLRSTQGALFHLNVETDVNLITKLDGFFRNGFEIYLTSLNGRTMSNMAGMNPEKCVLVFGNEANGISKMILAKPEYKQIKIETYTDCESLNVSVAAGILISEFKKILKK